MPARSIWIKNPKQREALVLLNSHLHTLLYGGSRSGKTYIAVRNIVLRALKLASRHLIVRLRFNHVKTSIWYDTFPKVMRECFPNIPYDLNRTDWFVTLFPKGGGESTIWMAGSDDPARMEKMLGNEYSTIFANEVSQLKWDLIPLMWTRLAESSGLTKRFYYDCNPPFKRHWSYTMFFMGQSPKGEQLLTAVDPTDPDSEMIPLVTANLQMNPRDNPSLSPEYLGLLMSLPQRAKDRYLKGLFLSDVEGALWSDETCTWALQRGHGEIVEVVIAVDPAVTNTEDSDEWGITVCGRDEYDKGGVIADHSGIMSAKDAAILIVHLYQKHQANCVVAEVNQGGDLVELVIHNEDPYVKVVKVRASKGKLARAEPVAQLYDKRETWHDELFPELVDELTTYVPHMAKFSPGRLDSIVWGLTHLVVGKHEHQFHVG